MRLKEPRLSPLPQEAWSEDARSILAPIVEKDRTGMQPFNIFSTLAHHPSLFRRWLVFANHVLGKSTLDVRTRELVILRIGYLCQAGYEWGQHVEIARAAGMSDEEIMLSQSGSSTPGIDERDRLLLLATEELHADAFITDETYAGLAGFFDAQELLDIVFAVGQYNLVSMVLNTFGVQLDEGLPDWDLKKV